MADTFFFSYNLGIIMVLGGVKMVLLEVKHLKKIYSGRFGQNTVEALRDVSFSVEEGEYVAIMGESG